MLCGSRPLRHHPGHDQEHRVRRRSALLRGRLCLPRDGRRRCAAEYLFSVARPAARSRRPRAYWRLGVPWAAQPAHAVGSQLAYSPAEGDRSHPNLSFDRSLAFSASVPRSRAGAWVCNEVSSRCAAEVTSATARSNASAFACEGLLKPDSLRTNCSADACTSSSVAGGSKLNSVLMFRHIDCFSLFARALILAPALWLILPYNDGAFTRCVRDPSQRVPDVPYHLQNRSA